MIRLTKVTDYGFILLTWMAYDDPAGVYNARDLAQTTHLPPPMVSKILKALAKGGILASHRGVKGGYRLARTSDRIQVLEIITALEGPVSITECIDETPAGDGRCTIERLCPIRVNWQRINGAVREALEGISLEEMTRPLAQHRISRPAAVPPRTEPAAPAMEPQSTPPAQAPGLLPELTARLPFTIDEGSR